MNDFAAVLAPKSDQINAQDLISGDMIVTIEAVKISRGQEQPISILLKDMDRVWRPCKTTGRCLMAAWGPDTSIYPGRSAQLYLDPDVKWGGLKVGGIRIRALTHITGELKIALAESKQNRKIITIKPLVLGSQPEQRREPEPRRETTGDSPAIAKAKEAAAKGTDAFRAWFISDEGKDCRATGELTPDVLAECKAIASGADELGPRMADNPFGGAPDTRTATDEEIQQQIADELAARNAELEGRA